MSTEFHDLIFRSARGYIEERSSIPHAELQLMQEITESNSSIPKASLRDGIYWRDMEVGGNFGRAVSGEESIIYRKDGVVGDE